MFRMAAVAGAVEAVRVHVVRGDDPNARDAGGLTPLMLACSRNKVQVARLLLECGADHRLLTPSGRSALDFASDAGASELVDVLTSLSGEVTGRPLTDHQEEILTSDPWSGDATSGEPDGWEPDEVPAAPFDDASLRLEIGATHAAIVRHLPRDDSAGWDDVDALLPERASRLLSPEDPESATRIRALFLRVLREGSVPDLLVDELARSPEGERDQNAAQALRTAIRDLGGECDERFEFVTPWDDFRVSVDPEESAEEGETVSDAIAFAEGLSSSRNEPLRLYQREFQSLPLLTAEGEVALGKLMEWGVAAACDSLAEWPEGVRYLIDACEMVRTGARSIRSLRAGGVDLPDVWTDSDDDGGQQAGTIVAPERADEADIEVNTEGGTVADSMMPAGGELFEIAALADRLRELHAAPGATTADARGVIRSLNPARTLLLELLDVAGSGRHQLERPHVRSFRASVATYLRAREALVRGNLKLAFLHARKQLFTGMDLADLTQEANLGLLRAADKFDWRRG